MQQRDIFFWMPTLRSYVSMGYRGKKWIEGYVKIKSRGYKRRGENTQCGVLGDGDKKHVREVNVVNEIKRNVLRFGLKSNSSNKKKKQKKNNNNLLTLSIAQDEVIHGVRTTPTPTSTPPTIIPKLTAVCIQNRMPFQGSECTTLSAQMDLFILTRNYYYYYYYYYYYTIIIAFTIKLLHSIRSPRKDPRPLHA